MRKKAFLILFLALALIILLIVNPFFDKQNNRPSIIDRLPNTSYKGKIHLLDFSKNLQRNLKEMQVPFRDFLSPDFLLSQAKTYGINIQKPIYIFGENEADWGFLIEVNDSVKLISGIQKLKNSFSFSDTLVNKKTIFHHSDLNLNIYYESDYLLLYIGDNLEKTINCVAFAKKGNASKSWKNFLARTSTSSQKVIISNTSNDIKSIGFNEVVLSHKYDSNSFKINTQLLRNYPINLKLKNKGFSFKKGKYTNLFANIHLDISKFRESIDENLIKFINKLTKNIGFPIVEFLDAWEGDLSFVRGGFHKMKQEYVETEMDDDFNVKQVAKERIIKVPEFSLLLSFNEKRNAFLSLLIDKGLLRKEKDIYYFLFSPALKVAEEGNQMIFYSGKYKTSVVESCETKIQFEYKSNTIEFEVDSINKNKVFGGISFPLDSLSNPLSIF